VLKNILLRGRRDASLENRTPKCSVFGASRGRVPQRNELKKAREGIFQHPVSAALAACDTQHGRNPYLLEPGDSLTFKGTVAHGAERLIEVPMRFLAVINYGVNI